MAITRRSFLAGLGTVTVGLLFRRQLDRVLNSLVAELDADPVTPDQLPSAAEITVQALHSFRPDRLIVPTDIAAQFMIEAITIGKKAQLAGPVSAEGFAPNAFDHALYLSPLGPGIEIRFRVRYIGKGAGAPFYATLIGTSHEPPRAATDRERLLARYPFGCRLLARQGIVVQHDGVHSMPRRSVLPINSGGILVS